MEGPAVAVSRSVLPEDWDYPDRGCELWPSCLQCPFPRCRYDEPGGISNSVRETRNSEIQRLRYEEGMAIGKLAARFGLSKRTIHRILKRSEE